MPLSREDIEAVVDIVHGVIRGEIEAKDAEIAKLKAQLANAPKPTPPPPPARPQSPLAYTAIELDARRSEFAIDRMARQFAVPDLRESVREFDKILSLPGEQFRRFVSEVRDLTQERS